MASSALRRCCLASTWEQTSTNHGLRASQEWNRLKVHDYDERESFCVCCFFYFQNFRALNCSSSAESQLRGKVSSSCKSTVNSTFSFHFHSATFSLSIVSQTTLLRAFSSSSMDPLLGNYLDRKWKHILECIGNLKTPDERKWRAKKQHTISMKS